MHYDAIFITGKVRYAFFAHTVHEVQEMQFCGTNTLSRVFCQHV